MSLYSDLNASLRKFFEKRGNLTENSVVESLMKLAMLYQDDSNRNNYIFNIIPNIDVLEQKIRLKILLDAMSRDETPWQEFSTIALLTGEFILRSLALSYNDEVLHIIKTSADLVKSRGYDLTLRGSSGWKCLPAVSKLYSQRYNIGKTVPRTNQKLQHHQQSKLSDLEPTPSGDVENIPKAETAAPSVVDITVSFVRQRLMKKWYSSKKIGPALGEFYLHYRHGDHPIVNDLLQKAEENERRQGQTDYIEQLKQSVANSSTNKIKPSLQHWARLSSDKPHYERFCELIMRLSDILDVYMELDKECVVSLVIRQTLQLTDRYIESCVGNWKWEMELSSGYQIADSFNCRLYITCYLDHRLKCDPSLIEKDEQNAKIFEGMYIDHLNNLSSVKELSTTAELVVRDSLIKLAYGCLLDEYSSMDDRNVQLYHDAFATDVLVKCGNSWQSVIKVMAYAGEIYIRYLKDQHYEKGIRIFEWCVTIFNMAFSDWIRSVGGWEKIVPARQLLELLTSGVDLLGNHLKQIDKTRRSLVDDSKERREVRKESANQSKSVEFISPCSEAVGEASDSERTPDTPFRGYIKEENYECLTAGKTKKSAAFRRKEHIIIFYLAQELLQAFQDRIEEVANESDRVEPAIDMRDILCPPPYTGVQEHEAPLLSEDNTMGANMYNPSQSYTCYSQSNNPSPNSYLPATLHGAMVTSGTNSRKLIMPVVPTAFREERVEDCDTITIDLNDLSY